MLRLSGLPEELPAVELPQQRTNADNAWLGKHYTIRLVGDLLALRVHSRGGIAAAASEQFVGSGTIGRWFAIGDVILTRQEYSELHALPSPFSHQDEWLLPAGSILNVGIAGPLFDHDGGALQAEWLSGPPLQRRPLNGYWTNKVGNA